MDGAGEELRRERLYAGIVSFNADMARLKENIDAISSQVDEVILFDNGSENQSEVVGLAASNISVITSRKNLGIAHALNVLMEAGLKKGYSWMLSLDQDSLCEDGFVDALRPYLALKNHPGIVAPVIRDRNVGIVGHNPKGDYAEVNTCITSGAFVNMDVWRLVGGYDESMFIDSVDFEFCYRVRKAGYRVIQVSSVQLTHEVGKSTKKRFLLWTVNVFEHSAFRDYYIARNNVYYPLKHHLWPHFLRGNFRNFRLMLLVILYEQDKAAKVRAILRGWKAGYGKTRMTERGQDGAERLHSDYFSQ